MRVVRDILHEKGGSFWSVGPDDTVFRALEVMAEKNVGAVLVIEEGALKGILSERDYARKIVLKGRMSRETRVREIMTENVISVHPHQSIEECMALMTGNRIRHLPVFEGDRIVGVISIGDVVRAIIEEQGFMIEQLTDYITGKSR